MARNIVDVINQIKPILTEQNLEVTKLDSIISSAQYIAPENVYLLWMRLQEELTELTIDHINSRDQPLPDWVVKVSDIVMGRVSAA